MTALETAGRVRDSRSRPTATKRGRECARLDGLERCGHLDQLLPKRQRLTKDHYFALPYDDVAPLMADLRRREGVAA